MKESKGK